MQGQTWGWGSPAIVALFAASAVLSPAFVSGSAALAPARPALLLNLQNFRAEGAILAGSVPLVGASVFGAIWAQEVLGFSAIRAGAALLPLTLPLLVVAPLGGRLYDRIGPRPLLTAGSALIALGFAWMAFRLHVREYVWMVPGYIALGVGLGLVISPATTDALGAAKPADRSQASGLVQTMRQIGGAVGLAVLGAIVSAVSHVAPDASVEERLVASTNGVAAAYWVGAGVMVAMALAAFLFVRRREPS